ncbi:E3 ubiquitin-protein ligase SMURF2 isoform X2 [Hyalella azteca]|uniref:HECT-type E3 ubiquitin transferase n=1 Tax=Hyalella azteca TaxID=294128 RepID=A0A979FRR0_HYAAZ|nr:E3 ubiquitin-protein ligase SMURF2 isoform X2 [Hyalella azteca]
MAQRKESVIEKPPSKCFICSSIHKKICKKPTKSKKVKDIRLELPPYTRYERARSQGSENQRCDHRNSSAHRTSSDASHSGRSLSRREDSLGIVSRAIISGINVIKQQFSLRITASNFVRRNDDPECRGKLKTKSRIDHCKCDGNNSRSCVKKNNSERRRSHSRSRQILQTSHVNNYEEHRCPRSRVRNRRALNTRQLYSADCDRGAASRRRVQQLSQVGEAKPNLLTRAVFTASRFLPRSRRTAAELLVFCLPKPIDILGSRDGITISVWNKRKLQKKGSNNAFLGSVLLTPTLVNQLKDTGYQRLELGRDSSNLPDDPATGGGDVRGQLIVSLMTRDNRSGSSSAAAAALAITNPLIRGPDDLPEGWEERRTAAGRVYYVDHNNRTTHWERPRPTASTSQQASSSSSPSRHSTCFAGNIVLTNPAAALACGETSSLAADEPNASTPEKTPVRRARSETMSGSNGGGDRRSALVLPLTPSHSSGSHHSSPNTPHGDGGGSSSQQRRRSARHRNYLTRNRLHDQPGDLPAHYELRTTSQGQVYYFNTESGVSTWHDPRIPRDLGPLEDSELGPLPTGWELRFTASGRPYFLNHVKRTTQFTDPRLSNRNVLNNILRNRESTLGSSQESTSTVITNMLSAVTSTQPVTVTSSTNNTNNNLGPNDTRSGSSSSNSSTTTTTTSSNHTVATVAGIPTSDDTLNIENVDPMEVLIDSLSRSRLANGSTSPHSRVSPPADLAAAPSEPVPNDNSVTHRTSSSNSNNSPSDHTSPTSSPNAASEVVSIEPVVSSPLPAALTTTNPIATTVTTSTPTTVPLPSTITSTAPTSASRTPIRRVPPLPSSSSASSAPNPNSNKDPAPPTDGEGHDCPPKYTRDLVAKLNVLRAQLSCQVPQSGHCRLDIPRTEVFEESFRQISKLRPKDLKKRLMVKFRGEEGLDYGGIAREWLYLLSHEMLNPYYGLFQYSRDDIYTLQINPDSNVNPEHLAYFYFVGRVIGLAVFHGHYIDGGFAMPFYKMLLNKPIVLEDIEAVDPDLYSSLNWMLCNDITDVMDSTTFTVEHDRFGVLQRKELKPGGSKIFLTEDNKKEYVKLYVNFRFMQGIERQFTILQKGFTELVSQELLAPFDERELELIIGGLGKIDVEDWKANTRLKHCTADTPIVICCHSVYQILTRVFPVAALHRRHPHRDLLS